MPESSDEADTPMILSEPFSMGLAFSSDLTDTLLSTVRATDSFVTCSHGLLLPISPRIFSKYDIIGLFRWECAATGASARDWRRHERIVSGAGRWERSARRANGGCSTEQAARKNQTILALRWPFRWIRGKTPILTIFHNYLKYINHPSAHSYSKKNRHKINCKCIVCALRTERRMSRSSCTPCDITASWLLASTGCVMWKKKARGGLRTLTIASWWATRCRRLRCTAQTLCTRSSRLRTRDIYKLVYGIRASILDADYSVYGKIILLSRIYH